MKSVLLDGVGIASSDIMSYQMCIVLFKKKITKRKKKKKGGGGAGKQCSNCLICLCLYSGLCAATGLEVDQMT